MQTLTNISEAIQGYVLSLDWSFMLTFMVLCYGMNHYKIKEWLEGLFKHTIRSRYLVLFTGLIYGLLLYIIRGYTIRHIENLLQSFVFALVFHKLIIESLLYWLAKHGLPQSIAKHLLDPDQLKKLYKP